MIKILFKLFSWLPLWALHILGVSLGLLVYGFSPSYRQKIRVYSKIALGGNKAQRLAAFFSACHAGMALMELPFLWGRSTKNGTAACTDFLNWHLVEQAQLQKKGILFLTPHMGSFESTAQAFSQRAPITVLYRPNRNREVQEIIEKNRARHNIQLAPTRLGGIKTLLKALRKGQAVGMLPDQVPAAGEGVWAPMFGKPAYTMTLPARLFHASNCIILIAIGYRKPFGRGFCLELFPGPCDLSDDPAQAASEINIALEVAIMKYPYQYYWGYERYKMPKGRPESESSS